MIVIGTTIATFAMSKQDTWKAWLYNAAEQKAQAAALGIDVKHFASIQIDARGLEPFQPFIDELTKLGGEYWVYSLDDGRSQITMTNRWRHITMGQNLVFDYCQAIPDCTHLLFMAADASAPGDIISKMLEMNHPLCAPYMSTYQLRGTQVVTNRRTGQFYPPEWGVEDAMASAACIFIGREVFRKIRWRWDADTQMSDDPCLHYDSHTLLDIPTYVRHDVLAAHYPMAVGAYETRFDPKELEIHK